MSCSYINTYLRFHKIQKECLKLSDWVISGTSPNRQNKRLIDWETLASKIPLLLGLCTCGDTVLLESLVYQTQFVSAVLVTETVAESVLEELWAKPFLHRCWVRRQRFFLLHMRAFRALKAIILLLVTYPPRWKCTFVALYQMENHLPCGRI